MPFDNRLKYSSTTEVTFAEGKRNLSTVVIVTHVLHNFEETQPNYYLCTLLLWFQCLL